MSIPPKRIEDPSLRRAALYIRVSTEEQAMHGLSLSAQRETLLQYAEDNGLHLVEVYADEGITARKKYKNRAAFMRMLRDVQGGRIDLILFIKLDRWFRSIADYYEVQHILDDHHVRWIATEEDYDTTTANGRLHLNIKLSIAQDESDRTSERIKFVFDSKLKRGEVVSGKVPLGYRITDKHLCVDPATAPIAQDIFAQYLSLRSLRALRQYVMETHGLVYSYSGIRALLQNRRYLGHAHSLDDFCPSLVTAAQFSQVQEVLAERAQRNDTLSPKRVYLFTGLVRCAECGNRLSAHTVGGKYVYYRCTRYEKLHLCPHRTRTSELVLEDWLLHRVAAALDGYSLQLESRPTPPPKRADPVKLKGKLEKLKDLYLNDLIDRDTYERDYTALRDALRNAMPVPRPHAAALGAPTDPITLYRELSRAHQREFWARLTKSIVVSKENEFTVVVP